MSNFKEINADQASGAINALGSLYGIAGSALDSKKGKPTLVGGYMKGAGKGMAMGAQLGSAFGPVGTGIGAAAGMAIGGISGAVGANKEQERIRIARLTEHRLGLQNESTTLQDDGEGEGLSYYRNGGVLKRALQVHGGKFKSLNSMAVKVEGNSHEDGGVAVPGQAAEVEGGETISGDYVFSDRLGFAKSHETLMRPLGKIEAKAPTRERVNSIKDILRRENELKQKQELVKSLING